MMICHLYRFAPKNLPTILAEYDVNMASVARNAVTTTIRPDVVVMLK